MSKRNVSVSNKFGRSVALSLVLALPFAMVANGQKPKCKKWTYDFSEVVKYSETPLDACKNYVKEKYPNDDYKPSVEATNDPETYRCSASETYIGVVYQRECESCCKKPTQPRVQSRDHFNQRRLIFNSLSNKKNRKSLAAPYLDLDFSDLERN